LLKEAWKVRAFFSAMRIVAWESVSTLDGVSCVIQAVSAVLSKTAIAIAVRFEQINPSPNKPNIVFLIRYYSDLLKLEVKIKGKWDGFLCFSTIYPCRGSRLTGNVK
jgi:hypothetical protein